MLVGLATSWRPPGVAHLAALPHCHKHVVRAFHLLRQHLPELGHLDAVVERGAEDAEARTYEEVAFCK